ncbi:MAG TPA: tail fiber protein [Verrucomicrobiae bacterium]|nr:tail fiber protein [Verrucomicrobiae bacterium]
MNKFFFRALAVAFVLLGLGQPSSLLAVQTGSTGGAPPTGAATAKPATTMTWMICISGIFPTSGENTGTMDSPYISEIRLFSGVSSYEASFNTSTWVPCNGQPLSIAQHSALFFLLNTTYGGNGTTTFNLPDLRGRVPIGAGSGPGLTPRTIGQTGGGDSVVLASNNLPAHIHGIPGTNTFSAGGGAAVGTMPAFIVLQPWIDDNNADNYEIGTIRWMAQSNSIPGLICDGRSLATSANNQLFTAIGYTFGGSGGSFNIPDLRGRLAIGAGTGPGLTARTLGQSGGVETYTLLASDIPAHTHTYPGGTTGSTGGIVASHNVMAPYLVLTPGVAVEGSYGPSTGFPTTAEVRFFADSSTAMALDLSADWRVCDGSVSLTSTGGGDGSLDTYSTTVGATWGGDGNNSVGLPDLRGRAVAQTGSGTGLATRNIGDLFGAETFPALVTANLPAHTHLLPPPFAMVSTLNITDPSPTNGATVNWLLTFASATTGVTANNFSLSGTATILAYIGVPTTTNSGLTWNIPVSTSDFENGTLTLTLANGTGLTQTITNLPFTGQSYTMDVTTAVPTLTAPAANTTNGNPITITYNLPEAALAGSVELAFIGSQSSFLQIAPAQSTVGTHSFTINPASPDSSANIRFGNPILNGTYTVELYYQDTLGNPAAGVTAANFTVHVNHPPVAGATFTLGITLGVPSTVQIIGGSHSPTDPDNDPLTLTGVSGATNGIVTTDGTNITYAATGGTTDSFTYTVSDGQGGTASRTVSVTIAAAGPGYNQLALQSLGGGSNVLTFLGTPGFKYALELATNLTHPINWQPQMTNPAAPNGWLIFTNVTAQSPVFYRTRYAP